MKAHITHSYYYTVTSLPCLFFGAPPLFTTGDFLLKCRAELAEKDLAVLRSARLVPEDQSQVAFLRNWYDWERQVRNELARLRARKLGRDEGKYPGRGETCSACVKLAQDVFSMERPEAAEKMLDQARWNHLEQMETGHYFDLEKLISYALKLKINEKQAGFNTRSGLDRQEAILACLPGYLNL